MHLGHVGFFRERVDESHIRIVGGNQADDGHSSIISDTVMRTTGRTVRRRMAGGEYRVVTMRLNTYVSLS